MCNAFSNNAQYNVFRWNRWNTNALRSALSKLT